MSGGSVRDALTGGHDEDPAYDDLRELVRLNLHANACGAECRCETLTHVVMVPVQDELDALWDQIHRDQHDAMDQAERAEQAEDTIERVRETLEMRRGGAVEREAMDGRSPSTDAIINVCAAIEDALRKREPEGCVRDPGVGEA